MVEFRIKFCIILLFPIGGVGGRTADQVPLVQSQRPGGVRARVCGCNISCMCVVGWDGSRRSTERGVRCAVRGARGSRSCGSRWRRCCRMADEMKMKERQRQRERGTGVGVLAFVATGTHLPACGLRQGGGTHQTRSGGPCLPQDLALDVASNLGELPGCWCGPWHGPWRGLAVGPSLLAWALIESCESASKGSHCQPVRIGPGLSAQHHSPPLTARAVSRRPVPASAPRQNSAGRWTAGVWFSRCSQRSMDVHIQDLTHTK